MKIKKDENGLPILDEFTAVYEYKCRRCDKVFDGCECGAKFASGYLIELLITGRTSGPSAAMGPRMIESHFCKKTDTETFVEGGIGVGDIIGFRIEDQNPKPTRSRKGSSRKIVPCKMTQCGLNVDDGCTGKPCQYAEGGGK